MKNKIHYLLIPVAIILLSQLFFMTHFWQYLENKAQDTLFHIRGAKPTSEEIAIVAIDDDTFKCLENWPFPRKLYGKMLRNLKKAGAKQVIFDIQFTERSLSEEDDLELAAAAEEFGNVVFAGELKKGVQDKFTQSRLITPVSFLRQKTANWGLVNISHDKDGYLRRYTLFEELEQNDPYYSIGVVALANQKILGSDWEWKKGVTNEKDFLRVVDKEIPIIDNNKALVQFYGEPGTFAHYSFFDVIDDEEFPELGIGDSFYSMNSFASLHEQGVFKDKIVLVGATAPVLQDLHHTPFAQRELMSGVEIHANFLEMVLQGDYLKQLSFWLFLFIVVAVTFLVYYIYMNIKPVISLVILILMIASSLFGNYSLFVYNNLQFSVLQIPAVLVLSYIAGLAHQYIIASREKKQIKNAFMHYMAPDLVNELLKNPASLKYGGSLQEITVLFSDIRAFTTYSENHTPEETVTILHEYLTEMVDIIIKNKGILDKFVGDEIMALYGTPVKLENAALAACKTAIEMRKRLDDLHKKWLEEGKHVFEIGIGINTGKAVVGNLGSEQIFDYTAIGDTVNLGARLEGINKEYKTQNNIIISEFTLAKVVDLVDVRFLDEVKVKGKNESVKIYELINIKVRNQQSRDSGEKLMFKKEL